MIRRIHDPGGSVMRSRTSNVLADPLSLAPVAAHVAREAVSAGTKTHPAADQTRKGANPQEARARTQRVHLRKGTPS